MKKPILLLCLLAVLSFSPGCDKQDGIREDAQPKELKHKGFPYSFSSGYHALGRVFAHMPPEVLFSAGRDPHFTQGQQGWTFSGGGGNGSEPVIPDLPTGCLISQLGYPMAGDYGWAFNYGGSYRLESITIYEDDFVADIIFSHGPGGRITGYEIWEEGEKFIQMTYTYDGNGRVISAREEVSGGEVYNYSHQYNPSGQLIRISTDAYGIEIEYTYSGDNVVKEVSTSSLVSEPIITIYRQFDNAYNFLRPLNVPQPFYDSFLAAWMLSRNNIVEETEIYYGGDTYYTDYYYTYNSEGYPSFFGSSEEDTGPIEYINCSK